MEQENIPFELRITFTRINGKIKLNISAILRRKGKEVNIDDDKLLHLLQKAKSFKPLKRLFKKKSKDFPYGQETEIYHINEETINSL